MGAAGQASGYEINQSIRFNDDDSAIMDRTPSSASNRKTWTWSGWVKRATDAEHTFFAAGDNSSNRFGLKFRSAANGGTLAVFDDISAATSLSLLSNRSMRDFSAWYHIVCAVDTTQSTASNRCKLYVNGDQVTDFSSASYMGQNTDTSINNTVTHRLGRLSYSSSHQFDGYLAEINFVDGSQLAPANFGETNTDTGQWVPIKYSGSYGTNGFYITGADSSDLGEDFSGNNNDFTSSGLTAADQMLDSPTDNFTTFNPIGSCNVSGQALTLSDGNLRSSAGGTSNAIEAIGTIAPTTGKYYAEFTLNAAPQLSNQYPAIGIIGIDLNITGGNNLNSSTFFGYLPSGNKLSGGSSSSYGDTYGNGDIIGIALDLDNQKIYFSKNGTYQNSGDPAAGSNAAFTNLVAGTEYRFCVSHAGSSATDVTMNAGQSAFNTAAPTGFSPMSTANLPAPTIADPSEYFQSVQYATTTSAQDITFGGNSDLAPDWLWFKRRDHASDHFLFDKVRGVLKTISSNDTNPEVTSAGSLTAFGTDGFSLGDGGSDNDINGASSSGNFMAWGWAAGGTSGSSNSDGSVTSTVSANTTAGFSICKLNPGGNNNITFGHGLGVAPRLVIVKNLEDATNWQVLHLDQGVGNKIFLNSSNAAASDANMWQNTAPTSTVVSMGTAQTTNEDVIAYCFAEISGYSKISNYVGNGDANGPFVNCGFKPAWVIGKRIGGSGGYFDWFLFDSESPGFNVTNERIHPNNVQATDTGAGSLDLVSNGFKIRTNTSSMNSSGDTIIFMAFAESPFKTATAR